MRRDEEKVENYNVIDIENAMDVDIMRVLPIFSNTGGELIYPAS